MNKDENVKIRDCSCMQKCILKVNVHCDGCKHKVKKILRKMDGVFITEIDSEQGKVTVSGNVDPNILIKKLLKSGKHAEIWGTPNEGNNNNNNLNLLIDEIKSRQIDNGGKGNGGKNKSLQKGDENNQPKCGPQPPNPQQQPQVLQQLLQQMRGFQDQKLPLQFKDMKLPGQPNPDPKAVKFNLPDDDEDCSDDEDFDDDEIDDEIDNPQASLNKMKGPSPLVGNSAHMMMNGMINGNQQQQFLNSMKNTIVEKNEKKGGGGGGGPMPIQMPLSMDSGNGGKKSNGGSSGGLMPIQMPPGMGGGNGSKKGGSGGGGGPMPFQMPPGMGSGNGRKKGDGGGRGGGNNQNQGGGNKNNGGKNSRGMPEGKNSINSNKNGCGAGGGNPGNNNGNEGKKGNPVPGGVQALNPMGGGHYPALGGGGSLGPICNMNMPMGLTGNISAMQGLPAGGMNSGGGGGGGVGIGGGPRGYLQGAGPESMPGNPFHQQHQQQQQYMAAMMNQQRAMGMAGGNDQRFQPMMYSQPPPAINYMCPQQNPYPYPYPPPQQDPYTHFFNDENTSSCSVM